MNKSTVLIVIILAIAAIAGVAWSVKDYSEELSYPGWKTATDAATGFSFRYPEQLDALYINTVDWPPKISVQDGSRSCSNAGSEIAAGGKSEEKEIEGRTFCVTKESGAAAGSIYTEYAYAFKKGKQTLTLTFGTRAVQCANYPDSQRIACEQERRAFDMDSLAARIAESVSERLDF